MNNFIPISPERNKVIILIDKEGRKRGYEGNQRKREGGGQKGEGWTGEGRKVRKRGGRQEKGRKERRKFKERRVSEFRQ